MTDTDRMVAWLREAMAAAQAAAEAATQGLWGVRPEPDAGEGWEIAVEVQPGREWRWVVGAEGGGGVYEKADADHIIRHQPRAVLRRIAKDRELLDDCENIIAGWHYDETKNLAEDAIRNRAEAWGWTKEQR